MAKEFMNPAPGQPLTASPGTRLVVSKSSFVRPAKGMHPIVDFFENGLSLKNAAERCIGCGMTPCATGSASGQGCPIGRPIPDTNAAVAKSAKIVERAIEIIEEKKSPEFNALTEEIKAVFADYQKSAEAILLELFEKQYPGDYEDVLNPNPVLRDDPLALAGLLQMAYPKKYAEISEIAEDRMRGDQALYVAKTIPRIFEILSEIDADKAKDWQEGVDEVMRQAFENTDEKGAFGDETCRICPDELCKGSCTPGDKEVGEDPVDIPVLQVFTQSYARERGFIEPLDIPEHKKRHETVVVVGSNFTGKAAAWELRKLGYEVIILEKNSQPSELGQGQILTYKVPPEIFKANIERILDSGIEIYTNKNLGVKPENAEDVDPDGVYMTLEDLSKLFNETAPVVGTIIATGRAKEMDLRLAGDAREEIINWSDVTQARQAEDLGGPVSPYHGRDHWLIVGVGDTAIDVARTAILQGAKELTFTSRKGEFNPADQKAYKQMLAEAEAAGVQIHFEAHISPERLERDEQGGYRLVGADTRKGHEGKKKTIEGFHIAVQATPNGVPDYKKLTGEQDFPCDNKGIMGMKIAEDDEAILKKPGQRDGVVYTGKYYGMHTVATGEVVRDRSNSLAAVVAADGQAAAAFFHAIHTADEETQADIVAKTEDYKARLLAEQAKEEPDVLSVIAPEAPSFDMAA